MPQNKNRIIRVIPVLFTLCYRSTYGVNNKRLEELLKREASGILNWPLEGTRHWRDEGLRTPPTVITATDEYRSKMDIMGNFVKNCCVQQSCASVKVRDLYKAYQAWCAENNEHTASERYLALRLQEISFDCYRSADARYGRNLGLKLIE